MKATDIDPKPQFFDRYIDLATDPDLLEALERHSPRAVFSDLDTLKALGDTVYAPGVVLQNSTARAAPIFRRLASRDGRTGSGFLSQQGDFLRLSIRFGQTVNQRRTVQTNLNLR